MEPSHRRAVRAASLAALAAVLLPTAAFAHTGVSQGGLADGFAHPFSGLDHLLTMVAVGLWAASLGGRAVWAVPATFVGVLALGAGLALAGIQLPAVELGIGVSVVATGLLVAADVKVPVAVAAALVGLFAIFHGHAHGAEMPELAHPLLYGLGFVAATVILHAAGIGLGFATARSGGALAGRVAGAAIAATGLVLVLQP